MKNNSLSKNSFIVLVLTTIGSGINYLCQILMGRILEIDDFGTVNTVFSCMLILGVVGNTASMILSKKIAENMADKNTKTNKLYVNAFFGILISVSMIILLVGSALVFLFKNVFHFDNYVFPILSLILIVLNFFPVFFQGIIGGIQKYFLLGLYTLIIPVLKFLGTVIIAAAVKDSEYAASWIILCIVLGNIVACIVGIIILAKNDMMISHKLVFKHWGDLVVEKNNKVSFWVNLLMLFFANIDILYLKIFVGGEEAGLYSAALMFGRIIYYCVTALVTVLLPMVAFSSKKNDTFGMLMQTVGFTFCLSVALLVPVNVWKTELLTLIYGKGYIKAGIYIFISSGISVATSMNTILANYMLAIGKMEKFRDSLQIALVCVIAIIVVCHSYEAVVLMFLCIAEMGVFIYNIFCCSKRTSI